MKVITVLPGWPYMFTDPPLTLMMFGSLASHVSIGALTAAFTLRTYAGSALPDLEVLAAPLKCCVTEPEEQDCHSLSGKSCDRSEAPAW